MQIRTALALILIPAVVSAGSFDQALPSPWIKNGVPPAKDECVAGVDLELEKQGKNNLTVSCDAFHEGFVGVMQRFSAENYVGRRLRFSASVKSDSIEDGWGGLWMRVDEIERRVSAFDNMQNRQIRGSTDWTTHSVVLDVLPGAYSISFGTILSGTGQLWVSDLRIEPVGKDVAVTGRMLPLEPRNLEIERSSN